MRRNELLAYVLLCLVGILLTFALFGALLFVPFFICEVIIHA